MIAIDVRELGQALANDADNGELDLPNAAEYHAKDYAIAIDAYTGHLYANAMLALENGEPAELQKMAKFLKLHCDMGGCTALALEGDFLCRHHRNVENALTVEYEEAKASDLEF